MKQILLGNLGTKGMALALGTLMWVFLFSSGIGHKDCLAKFQPILSLAHDVQESLFIEYYYRSSDQSRNLPLIINHDLSIQIAGPRAEVEKLKQVFFKPSLDNDLFSETSGSFTHEITIEDFALEPPFRLLGKSHELEVKYQRYLEKKVSLLATLDQLEGEPASGYEVKAVRCTPEKINVRVIADQAKELLTVPIKSIPIHDRTDGLILSGEIKQDPLRQIKPAENQNFLVQIDIHPTEHPRELGPLTLHIQGKPDVVLGVELEPSSIFVEVRGPKEIVEKLQEQDLTIFVPVDQSLTPGEKRSVPATDLRFYFKDPKLRSILSVILMSKKKVENRQVTLSLPEKDS